MGYNRWKYGTHTRSTYLRKLKNFIPVFKEFRQSFERFLFIMQGVEAVNSLGPAQHGFSPYTFNGG